MINKDYMKRTLIFGLMLCLSASLSWAQTGASKKKINAAGVIASLTASESGQGTVKIMQDERMVSLLTKSMQKNEEKQNISYSGYRVQVYMANNQKKSKAETYKREEKLKEKFPDLSYYVTFTSPFWKLKVGDFRNYTDALALGYKLKEEYPEYAGDMIIVRDDEVRDLEMEKSEGNNADK